MPLLKFGGRTSKVGYRVPTFNLPAVSTCPGSTPLCRSICYASTGFYTRELVRDVYAEAYAASTEPDFVDRMSRELGKLEPGTAVRIHAALEWLTLLPNVQLFASVDDDTGDPPGWMRRAIFVDSFDELADDETACPYQRDRRFTCDRCTYCFKPAGHRKRHVAFRPH